MTSVVVYEHVTATWAGDGRAPLSASLLREGRAMLDAVAEDLQQLPGIELNIAANAGRLLELSARADFTLLIAPEFDGILCDLATQVVKAGGRLLGPTPEAIRLTGDKLQLSRWWLTHGVPGPVTWEYDGKPAAIPIVVKPRDGAGSQATRLLNPGETFAEQWSGPLIAQEYVEGLSASVALLCGPAGLTPLWPCEQLLSGDGRFEYLGGRTLTDAELCGRAADLALRAVECVPGVAGYVGVDVVLGADGRDWAIEINPRITTSYIGLRKMTDANLMASVISMVRGKAPTVGWWKGEVTFTPMGSC